jgi:hypothetical protein
VGRAGGSRSLTWWGHHALTRVGDSNRDPAPKRISTITLSDARWQHFGALNDARRQHRFAAWPAMPRRWCVTLNVSNTQAPFSKKEKAPLRERGSVAGMLGRPTPNTEKGTSTTHHFALECGGGAAVALKGLMRVLLICTSGHGRPLAAFATSVD